LQLQKTAGTHGGMVGSVSHLRLLVVDDEPGIRAFLAWRLRARGLTVEVAHDGQDALDKMQHQHFDLVIADITMPRLEGLALLEAIKQKHPMSKVILMTGFSTVETAVNAMRLGAFDFLLKPFRLSALLKTVDRAIEEKGEAA
jgi:DNA-binding NtrC family response regulator